MSGAHARFMARLAASARLEKQQRRLQGRLNHGAEGNHEHAQG